MAKLMYSGPYHKKVMEVIEDSGILESGVEVEVDDKGKKTRLVIKAPDGESHYLDDLLNFLINKFGEMKEEGGKKRLAQAVLNALPEIQAQTG